LTATRTSHGRQSRSRSAGGFTIARTNVSLLDVVGIRGIPGQPIADPPHRTCGVSSNRRAVSFVDGE
jgi:hypothetical protein